MSGDAGNPGWGEIQHALGVVLELSEEQREANLARQAWQIGTEVESLLAAHGRAGSFPGTVSGAQAQPTRATK